VCQFSTQKAKGQGWHYDTVTQCSVQLGERPHIVGLLITWTNCLSVYNGPSSSVYYLGHLKNPGLID